MKVKDITEDGKVYQAVNGKNHWYKVVDGMLRFTCHGHMGWIESSKPANRMDEEVVELRSGANPLTKKLDEACETGYLDALNYVWSNPRRSGKSSVLQKRKGTEAICQHHNKKKVQMIYTSFYVCEDCGQDLGDA